MMNQEFSWMNEKVQTIKGHKFFYKFICFFTFRARRKMKYSDLYLIYYGIHKKKLGDKNAKKKALDTILKIYKENNGVLPKGL